jgi:hypothetical protein
MGTGDLTGYVLPPGFHTVTLAATDSDLNTVTDTVNVTVNAPIPPADGQAWSYVGVPYPDYP